MAAVFFSLGFSGLFVVVVVAMYFLLPVLTYKSNQFVLFAYCFYTHI